jgi:hypothetical protein
MAMFGATALGVVDLCSSSDLWEDEFEAHPAMLDGVRGAGLTIGTNNTSENVSLPHQIQTSYLGMYRSTEAIISQALDVGRGYINFLTHQSDACWGRLTNYRHRDIKR